MLEEADIDYELELVDIRAEERFGVMHHEAAKQNPVARIQLRSSRNLSTVQIGAVGAVEIGDPPLPGGRIEVQEGMLA